MYFLWILKFTPAKNFDQVVHLQIEIFLCQFEETLMHIQG